MTKAQPEPVVHPTTRSCPFDPHDGLRELREERPLAPMRCDGGRRGWLVTSHALVREVLTDPRFGSSYEMLKFPITVADSEQPAPPGLFSVLDPPEHTWYRRKLSAGFGPRRMRAMTSLIERIVADRLTAMRRAGGPADLVTAFAEPVTHQVIGELLGIRIADEEAFRRSTEKMFTLAGDGDRMGEGWAELSAVLAEFVHEKRERPGDDLLSALNADDELSAEEITTMAVILVTAAQDATTSVFALGSYALLANPDQLDALRAAPSLIDSAVEELLRYLTINQFGSTRVALADFEFHGESLRYGDLMTLSLAAANRDPAQFPDPDRLDLTRAASGHLAFGHGVHHCFGAQLARIVLRTGFAGLLRELPGLRLAIPAAEVQMRDDSLNYSVRSLPVDWD
ncbi:Cytochrome P450 [Saccharopolyspora kobensis]|uniref:Cytochrome P450 n=1 Tax=Saccharopolyspora kobensis TaxID=146035 RepID=A0A1H5ZQ93_9PSEU|nr:cytochrome P450 [Saccharopolyspora kobensis]SEG38733.1 Cytochrome P450 [Saccharopolyspora kobensis]SFE12405.1 Cytochrome P450 [Saccharopolyspora kobensis]